MTKAAKGTTISIGGVAIAKVTNIGGPSMSRNMIDATSHDSTAFWQEFIKGLKDGGEVSIEGNFKISDAGQLALIADFDDDSTLPEIIITIPTDPVTTCTFDGAVTAFDTDKPHDGKIGFSASIKVSGKPTISTAASNNLSALALTTATLIPTFAAGTYAYVATSTGASITVTPTAAAGTITVNGVIVLTANPSGAISLGVAGTVTRVTIVVQESGKSRKTYVVDVAKTA